MGGCASTSPLRRPRRRALRSESWSTSCGRPRRSPRRLRPGTSASTAAVRSTRRSRSKATLGDAILGGERNAVRIDGFDVGASPREFLGEPRTETVIFSTTNGTRAILETAARADHVVLGSLLNLDAVAAAARELGDDVTIVCAGFQGQFALDDAYCAGRIVQLLDAEPSDCGKGRGRDRAGLAGRARGAPRPHVRPARARGGHRVLRPGERPRRRSAARAAWWRRGRDHPAARPAR